MKQNKKIICMIIFILLICFITPTLYAATCSTCGGDGEVETPWGRAYDCSNCSGTGEAAHTAGEIIDEAGSFIDKGKQNADSKIDPNDLKDMSDTLYNILLVVAIIAALIVGLIMGIKFLLGSLEEKAEIKTMIIPYIIGCVVAFGAFTIWQIVVDLLQTL